MMQLDLNDAVETKFPKRKIVEGESDDREEPIFARLVSNKATPDRLKNSLCFSGDTKRGAGMKKKADGSGKGVAIKKSNKVKGVREPVPYVIWKIKESEKEKNKRILEYEEKEKLIEA